MHERDRCASVLWDSAAASVTGLVAQRAEAHATEVVLGNAQGFEPGNHVRFEGHGLAQGHHGDPDLYRVTGRTDQKITIERHDCREISLVDCTCLSGQKLSGQLDGAVLELVLEDDLNSAALQELRPRSLVKELPANTRDRVKELQADSDANSPTSWLVVKVERDQGEEAQQPAESPRKIHVRLAPNGLTAALDPWNTARASTLALAAHAFQTCIEVDWTDSVHAQQEWTEGMQVQIGDGSKAKHPTTALRFVETESGKLCRPGEETVETPDIRRVVRIIHHRSGTQGESVRPTMTLILDEPLSSEHEVGAPVVPARPIRARRYEGHACAVPIDIVDPSVAPSPAKATSPYDLGGKQPLVPTGLSLLLSVENQPGPATTSPVGIRGDGWTFAARAGGWVERPIFAPVDEVQRGWAPLAELRWREDGSVEVIDVRPVPAPHAHHGWLADIADTADEIAVSTHAARAEAVAKIARRAEGKRAQRELVREIGLLAHDLSGWSSANPACTRAYRLLRRAVSAVDDPELPTAQQLSRLASAMERLACAAAMADRVVEQEPEQHDEQHDEQHGEQHPGSEPAAGAPPAGPATQNASADTAEQAPAATVQEPPAEAVPAPSPEEPPHPAADEPQVTASTEPAPAAEHEVPADASDMAATADAEPAHTEADDAPAVGPDERTIAPSTVQASASVHVVDIAGLPTRLVHSNRGLPPGRRDKWPTLRHVPAPSTLPRGQERRLAEVIAELLDYTADIGRRALAGEDRAALQTALNAMWKSRFELNQLDRPIRVEDAIAFHDSRSHAAGGKR